MISGRISPNDRLFRSVVFPLPFRAHKVFVPKMAFRLVEKDGCLIGSLAWERYLPTLSDVHSFGCRLAARMNESKRAGGLLKEKDRRVYCGAYQFTADRLRGLSNHEDLQEVDSVDVKHLPEDGELAHVELSFKLEPDVVLNDEIRTLIADRIWSVCRGPIEHCCSGDEDIIEHPRTKLDVPPSGKYSDDRNSIYKYFCRIRARILLLSLRKTKDQ